MEGQLGIFEKSSVFVVVRTLAKDAHADNRTEEGLWAKLLPVKSLLPDPHNGLGPLSKLQEGALVGLCEYLILTKGSCVSRLLPFLLFWCDHKYLHPQRRELIVAYTYQLCRMANTLVHPGAKEDILKAFEALLEGTEEDDGVWTAVLEGLGACAMPFSKEQLKVVFERTAAYLAAECQDHELQCQADAAEEKLVAEAGQGSDGKRAGKARDEDSESKENGQAKEGGKSKESGQAAEEGKSREEAEGGNRKEGGKGKEAAKEKKKSKKRKGRKGRKEDAAGATSGGDGEGEEMEKLRKAEARKLKRQRAVRVARAEWLSLEAMYQFSLLSMGVCDREILGRMLEVCMSYYRTSLFVESRTLVAAVRLSVRCTLRMSGSPGDVVRHVAGFLANADVDLPPSQIPDEDGVRPRYSARKWDVCRALLEGAVSLMEAHSAHFQTLSDAVVAFLLDRLTVVRVDGQLTPSPEDLYLPTIDYLASIALVQLDERGFRSVRVMLNNFSHRLADVLQQSQDPSADGISLRQQNEASILISTLAHVTIRLNRPYVTQLVLPALLRHGVGDAVPSAVGAVYMENVAAIATRGDTFAYNTVADFFVNEYRSVLLNPTAPRSKFVHSTVPGSLLYMARNLAHAEHRSDFLLRMLKLFQQIGFQLQRKKTVDRVGVVGTLGVLLPVLSSLLTNEYGVNQPTPVVAAAGAADPATDAVVRKAESQKANAKLLRDAWFFVVCFGFVDHRRVLPEWYEAVKQLALYVDVFLFRPSYASLECEVEFQTLLRNSVEDADASELRKSLQTKLPAVMATQIRDLVPAQCAFVLSVLHAEVIRGSQGNLQSLFVYLGHLSTVSAPIVPFIRAIADLVLAAVMQYTRASGPDRDSGELEAMTEFLLVKFAHREPTVRAVSDRFLGDIVMAYPQLLWSRACLDTLLALVRTLSNVCGAGSFEGDMLEIVSIPGTQYTIVVPDGTEDRRTILSQLLRLAAKWIESAITRAPLEVGSILQEYVRNYHTIVDTLDEADKLHAGLSLVLDAGISGTRQTDALQAQPMGVRQTVGSMLTPGANVEQVNYFVECFGKDVARGHKISGPGFVSSLKTKSLYAGEVNGMLNLLEHTRPSGAGLLDGSAAGLLELIVDQIVKNLTDTMSAQRQYTDNRGAGVASSACRPDSEQQFEANMYRGVAIMIRLQELDSNLLHVLCWAPFVMYTTASMTTGVFAWRWLLAARPEVHFDVMRELKDVWEWSIEQRVGLFTDVSRPPSPLAIQQGGAGDRDSELRRRFAERLSDVRPHRIFLDWVMEHFTVVSTRTVRETEIYGEMLLSALKNPTHFSPRQDSLCARFQLLLFCFEFIHGGMAKDSFVEYQIRSGIYNAAASWFFHPPLWHTFSSFEDAEKGIGYLISFCRVLTADRTRTLKGEKDARSTASQNGSKWFGDVLADLEAKRVAAGARRRGTTTGAGRPDTSRAGLNSDDFGLDGEQRKRGWSIRPSILDKGGNPNTESAFDGAGLPAGAATEGMPVDREEFLQQVGRLLVLLIGHEVDRMVTWLNPQNRLKLKIADQDTYSSAKCAEWLSAKWRKYITIAWCVSPLLAFQMGNRFPFRKVRKTLEVFARTFSARVTHIPEALPYLVTPANAKANIPELRHLLHWAPCEPPLALSFLHASYEAHPYVTQYAVRVLRDFSAKTIIFYLPQLVQTLRYDVRGDVIAYLVKASQQSPVLAHQLIWNTLTVESAVEGRPLPVLGGRSFYDVTTLLREGILEGMSPRAQELYRDEFDFFNAVTRISELLLPLNPQDRRASLKEELRKIPIHGKLYLPTSPNTTVLAINYDRASPMQSAAKVPIMVSFLVTSVAAIADEAEDAEGAEDTVHESRPALTGAAADKAAAESAAPEPADPEQVFCNGEEEGEGKGQAERKGKGEEVGGDDGEDDGEDDDDDDDAIPPVSEGSSMPVPVAVSDPKEKGKGDKGDGGESSAGETTLEAAEKFGLRDPHPKDTHWQACIFKAGDDIRQDVLALQVIDLCKRVFQSVGLDLYLFPYRVIATAPGSGIIEVVPNAESRDRLGKKVEGKSLYDYFIQRHGPPESVGFQRARRNFMSSMAAYSVISFVLQIKDRHNGNLLVDDEGHIVHIDFGFLFDISPGGNLKFERSHFKLSGEMLELMGGKPDAPQFKWFMAQTVRGFLALREHADAICTLVTLMTETDFPCFTDQSITNLRARLCCEKTERDAAEFMSYKVIDSCAAISFFTTYLYDIFQSFSNGIDM